MGMAKNISLNRYSFLSHSYLYIAPSGTTSFRTQGASSGFDVYYTTLSTCLFYANTHYIYIIFVGNNRISINGV